jgi:3-hydroxyisobutyryl-CoA hydrolase
MSTKESSGDEPDDVLFNSIYGLRSVELNRPKKLNSLNGSMARKIVPRLQVRFPRYPKDEYMLSVG